ncbi:GNAT family N-acetyltransferase [Phytohabitans aurantiacus]|uniref:GNAT family N-acetyltransferase n=1 Tax=Phytohabitans aurantiacus TaxID=3016789 RepID=UPI00248FEC9A|nr:GNAT family N-acetyltransferase [Phytohabitans aurantiacus]
MLRRQDVGHRVVVRRIVGTRNNRPLYSDALGELIEVSETDLTLATKNGPLRVPLDEIHRAKRVPPSRRPNAADVVALELASNETWPAPVQDRLGEWLLRAADGWTGRANSALPIGDPDRPLEAAIDAIERWYAERGQPPLINTPLPLAAPVGAALDARGWGARPLTLVQTAPLPAIASTIEVDLATTPTEGWLRVAGARKSGLPDAAVHILTAVPEVRFAHVYGQPGDLIAIGRGAVTADRRWLGLSLIEVVPEARRRGLAQQVIGALSSWAAELGVPRAFLQVEERNTAAVALYTRLGFTTHHAYLTRTPPPP